MKFILVASLILNLSLGVLLCWRFDFYGKLQAQPARSPDISGRPADLGGVSAPVYGQEGVGARLPSDIPATLRYLKKIGASSAVCVAVARALLEEKYAQEKMRVLFPNGYTRMSSDRGSGLSRLSVEFEEFNKKMRDELQALVGADLVQSQLDLNPLQALKWKNIPDELKVELRNLERDFEAIRINEKYNRGISPSEMGRQRLLDLEYEQDIRALLAADVADDYLLYNSPFVKILQNDLASAKINLTEEQYKLLIEGEKKLRDIAIEEGKKDSIAPDANYLLAEVDMLRNMTDSDAALRLAVHRYADFREIDGLLISSGVTADQRLQVFDDYVQGFARLSGATADANAKNNAMKLYLSLTSQLTPSTKAKFDAGKTGAFLKKLSGL
jgi:hypothetical protein